MVSSTRLSLWNTLERLGRCCIFTIPPQLVVPACIQQSARGLMFLLSTDKNLSVEAPLGFCCWISKFVISTVCEMENCASSDWPVPPRANFTYLSVQCDGTGLTLGADSLWPWRMTLAASLDLTANVLQCCKLSSEEEQNKNYNRNGCRK